MAYVYIIQSGRSGRYYIGSTNDVKRRLQEHQQGKHHSSKRFLEPRLVFSQEVENISIARKIEARLKSYKRRDFIEKIIKDGVIHNLGPIAQLVRAGDS